MARPLGKKSRGLLAREERECENLLFIISQIYPCPVKYLSRVAFAVTTPLGSLVVADDSLFILTRRVPVGDAETLAVIGQSPRQGAVLHIGKGRCRSLLHQLDIDGSLVQIGRTPRYVLGAYALVDSSIGGYHILSAC